MTTKTAATASKDRRIIVLSSGWVFMGEYHEATPNAPAFVTEAQNIRKWGTTAGLGEIALRGPTKETQLDPVGLLLLDNAQSVLFTIKCTY